MVFLCLCSSLTMNISVATEMKKYIFPMKLWNFMQLRAKVLYVPGGNTKNLLKGRWRNASEYPNRHTLKWKKPMLV